MADRQKLRALYAKATSTLDRWSAAHKCASGLFASAVSVIERLPVMADDARFGVLADSFPDLPARTRVAQAEAQHRVLESLQEEMRTFHALVGVLEKTHKDASALLSASNPKAAGAVRLGPTPSPAEATTRSGSPSNVNTFSRSSLGGGLNPAMATLAANDPGAPVAVEAPADWPTSATGAFDRRSPSPSTHANFPSSKIFNVAFNTVSLVADGVAAGFAPGLVCAETVSGDARDSANSGAATTNPDAASASARSTRSNLEPR